MTDLFNRINLQQGAKRGVVLLVLLNGLVFILFSTLCLLFFSQGIKPEELAIYFHLNASLSDSLQFPWTIISHLFSHFGFLHLLFNLLFLWVVGSLFENFFGKKWLILTYILGGLFGNLIHVLVMNEDVYGASASIMALFVAAAFHQPKLPIMLFGVINIPIYVLAILFVVIDFLGLGLDDQKAHLAHLGGALFGLIFSIGKNNLIPRLDFGIPRKDQFFRKTQREKRYKSDEEFNEEKVLNQKKIDQILDKISSSGYESLTKKEKDFLFKQGKP